MPLLTRHEGGTDLDGKAASVDANEAAVSGCTLRRFDGEKPGISSSSSSSSSSLKLPNDELEDAAAAAAVADEGAPLLGALTPAADDERGCCCCCCCEREGSRAIGTADRCGGCWVETVTAGAPDASTADRRGRLCAADTATLAPSV